MNGNFDDDEAIQNEKERNKSGILQGVDHFQVLKNVEYMVKKKKHQKELMVFKMIR